MGGGIEDRAGWAQVHRALAVKHRPRHARRPRRRNRAGAALIVLGGIVVLTVPIGLRAATQAPVGVTFTVSTTTDAVDANLGNSICASRSSQCTLRAAVQQANALPGADTIILPAGTYELAIPPLNQNLADVGDLDITDSVTITGAGAGGTIVDGGTPAAGSPVKVRGLDRLFEVLADGGAVTLSGLTLRDGYAAEYGGALMNNSTASVTVADASLTGNVAEKAGGGIDNHLGGTLRVEDSMLADNVSFESGSALNNQRNGTLTISSTTITSNSAIDLGLDEAVLGAGAIANNAELDAVGTITVTGSSISDNTAGGSRSGAALSNDGAGTVVVRTTTFSKNRAKVNGGAIFNAAGEITVDDSTFTENAGESGGAIFNGTKDGRLTVRGSTFSQNDAAARGGAIATAGTGHLDVSDSTFSKNTAEGWGGAIVNDDKGSVTIRNSTFTENSGLNGGGFGNEGDGAVLVDGSTFTKNAAFVTAVLASGEGGGLHSNSSGELVVTGGLFSENRARSGGGLGNEGGGQLTITGTSFTANHADEKGGGILIQSGTVRMVDIDVVGNIADAAIEAGGGIAYEGDKLVSVGEAAAIESSRIRGNKAKGQGGGIDSRGDGPLDIATTTIEGNTAAVGGGIHHVGDAPLDVIRSTLSGNAAENGGGLFTDGDGETTVVNSTLSGNRAGQFGGGLLVSSRLTVRSSTIAGNAAPAGGGVNNGGGDLVGDGTVVLANTILAGNAGGNCAGTITSHGGNVEGADACQLRQLSDQPATDPRIGPLADNGGPTLTHALLVGSPAQNRAECTDAEPCPEVDQRGVARPALGGFDVGAVESSVEPPGGAGGASGPCTGRTERPVGPDYDSWISQGAPGTNRGGDSILKVASQITDNQRALVHFPLPGIPPGCALVGASLRLYSSAATDGRTLDVLRVASAWSESEVTWASQPATAGSAAAADSGLDFREWNVLGQALEMYQHGAHGFLIRDRTEGGGGAQSFHSREKGTDRPPVLVLVFDDPDAPPTAGECTGTPLRLSADRDSWVSEGSPGNNFGSDSTLKIKSQVGSNSRVLIGFPLPALPPACTGVAFATLRLEASSAKEGRTLRVRQASAPWTESGVTWVNQPSLSGPVADTPSFDGQLEWDVTAGVAELYATGNNGFVIRDADENGVGDEQTLNSRHKITDVTPELVLLFSNGLDTTPPVVTLSAAPSSPTTETSATFDFSSEDGAVLSCLLDDVALATCASPAMLSALPLGDRKFEVRATDAAGNTGSAVRTWTIVAPDTTAPEVTLSAAPSSPTTSTSATFSFSSEAGAMLSCLLDDVVQAICASPTTLAGLGVGLRKFEVTATDAAGNTGSAVRTWTIVAADTTAPVVTLSAAPTSPTILTSATFEFSSEEGAMLACKLDGVLLATCSSPTTLTGLVLGLRTFEVTATDAAGNAGSAVRSWTIVAPDTAAPVITITGPSPQTSSTTALLTFMANEPLLGGFRCALDGAVSASCTSPVSLSGLGLGLHSFRVEATDLAGTTGSATHEWTIMVAPDLTPPVVTINSQPPSSTSSTSATFTFTANEPATFQCALDSGPFTQCNSGSVTYSGLSVAEHVFRVQATDTALNTSVMAGYTWTVVAVPPAGCTPQSVTLRANADTWVLESSGTSNYGGDSAIKVDSKSGANARVLVRFPLPTVPSGCRITSASLRLYASSYKTGRTLQAVALSSPWSENSVTWSNQPAAGGAVATSGSGSGYLAWNVTEQVASMTSASNHGFVIRDASTDGDGVEQAFNSREKGTDNPPQLVVLLG